MSWCSAIALAALFELRLMAWRVSPLRATIGGFSLNFSYYSRFSTLMLIGVAEGPVGPATPISSHPLVLQSYKLISLKVYSCILSLIQWFIHLAS